MVNKMFHKIKRTIQVSAMVLAIGIGSVFVPGNVVVQAAEQTHPVCDNWLEPAKIYDYTNRNEGLNRLGAPFASSYDARTINGVSAVKDQGNYNTCWSFASIAAMECNLIKKGYADASIDLSENQFAYFFYNRQPDRLGFTTGDRNYGSKDWSQNGGSLMGSGLALSTWAGVTTEAMSPYVSTPSPSLCYQSDYSVQSVYFYSYDAVKNYQNSIDTVKQAIMDHGAVAAGFYFEESGSYYNRFTGAYFYNKATGNGNHAITIVGWDDNYKASNFALAKPTRNGAWIVKNSWGPSFGKAGYNYISYEDTKLTDLLAVEAVPAGMQYQNNYQYDGSANPAMSIGLPSGTMFANVFKASASAGGVEELGAVSVCTMSTNTTAQVQIYTGLSDAKKPTSGTKVFAQPVAATFGEAGYHMIQLPSTVALVPGERFAVVVTLSNPLGNPYIALDMTGVYNWIGFTSYVEKNQSFIYYNKKWMDCVSMNNGGKMVSGNLRIKAYTNVTDIPARISFTERTLSVSKGGTANLSLAMSPMNLYRKVTWSSANKNVASISSTGKVKGKAYGTTTVKAKYVFGASTKTITCKITVGSAKIKGFSASAKGNQLVTKWKKTKDASGYTVYYATTPEGPFKALGTAKRGSSKLSKRLNPGTYYVKMRGYRLSGKKKLYGSYTAVKTVTIGQ